MVVLLEGSPSSSSDRRVHARCVEKGWKKVKTMETWYFFSISFRCQSKTAMAHRWAHCLYLVDNDRRTLATGYLT